MLNRAARVMAAGHGGQVLLDGTTAGLCSSIDLIALGPRRLRDIAKPVEMFQVLALGLRREFPPLKTLDVTPGNLRPQTTSLVGRESELAEVQEVLTSVGDTHRGGWGRRKTRQTLRYGDVPQKHSFHHWSSKWSLSAS